MKPKLLLALCATALLMLGACNRNEDSAPSEMAPPPSAQPITPAPTPAPALGKPDGDAMEGGATPQSASCSMPCPDGNTASISCALDQIAICDCTMDPRARCDSAPAQ